MVYHIFLKKDTFFKTNRYYLIVSLLASMLVPFIDLSALMPVKEQVFMVLLDPVVITPEGIQTSIDNNNNIFQIGLAVYLTGVFIFTTRFAYQLFQLIILVKRFGISRKQGMRIVFTEKNYAPFSFFNLIFLNREDINSEETRKIIAHEQVHIRQWHSLDLILLEIITIILWFNPFVWLYRHAIKTLHEYLADEGVLYSGVDVKVYSALLFEQGTGIQINDLTNNFSKSLLKRRFTMMTKKRTTQLARIKLLLALPLALSFMLVISFSPDMLAQQEKKTTPTQGEKLVTEPSPDDPPPPPKHLATTDKTTRPETTIITVIEVPADQVDDSVFLVVKEMPKYPGGFDKMYAFLGENIKYPADAKKNGVSGTVYITFVVKKDGVPTNFKILRGIGAGCDEEALRVMKLMPKWEPGMHEGEPVNVQYNLPIKFTLAPDKEKEKAEDK